MHPLRAPFDCPVILLHDVVQVFLLRMADRFGQPGWGETVMLSKMTHRAMAAHVGTSRKLITAQMNSGKRQGLLDYSSKGIEIHRLAVEQQLRVPTPIVKPRKS